MVARLRGPAQHRHRERLAAQHCVAVEVVLFGAGERVGAHPVAAVPHVLGGAEGRAVGARSDGALLDVGHGVPQPIL